MPKFKYFHIILKGTLGLLDDGFETPEELRERAIKRAYEIGRDLGQLEVTVLEKIEDI